LTGRTAFSLLALAGAGFIALTLRQVPEPMAVLGGILLGLLLWTRSLGAALRTLSSRP
jgi:hypothetical protein